MFTVTLTHTTLGYNVAGYTYASNWLSLTLGHLKASGVLVCSRHVRCTELLMAVTKKIYGMLCCAVW